MIKNKIKQRLKTSINSYSSYFKSDNGRKVLMVASVMVSAVIIPELAFANNAQTKDAFLDIYTKASGWLTGGVGKMLTFSSFAMAGIMGVGGFPAKHVVGAAGLGLLLSSADSIITMIFG